MKQFYEEVFVFLIQPTKNGRSKVDNKFSGDDSIILWSEMAQKVGWEHVVPKKNNTLGGFGVVVQDTCCFFFHFEGHLCQNSSGYMYV